MHWGLIWDPMTHLISDHSYHIGSRSVTHVAKVFCHWEHKCVLGHNEGLSTQLTSSDPLVSWWTKVFYRSQCFTFVDLFVVTNTILTPTAIDRLFFQSSKILSHLIFTKQCVCVSACVCERYWPAGGLGLAGKQIHRVIGEAGAGAHLLSDEGELTAQTGHTAPILWLCIQPYSRGLWVLLPRLIATPRSGVFNLHHSYCIRYRCVVTLWQ